MDKSEEDGSIIKKHSKASVAFCTRHSFQYQSDDIPVCTLHKLHMHQQINTANSHVSSDNIVLLVRYSSSILNVLSLQHR